jgi:ABC-type amino acid transport substrate-binding protein
VRRDDVEVARKLQAAMNEMRANGELRAIFAKYGVQSVTP